MHRQRQFGGGEVFGLETRFVSTQATLLLVFVERTPSIILVVKYIIDISSLACNYLKQRYNLSREWLTAL